MNDRSSSDYSPPSDPPQSHTDRGRRERRLLLNAGRLFSGTTLASVLGLASFALAARTLGLFEFGMLALIVTYANAMHRLCSFQSWQAIIKFASDYSAAGESEKAAATFQVGFVLDFGACCVAAALTYFTASLAAGFLGWVPEVSTGVELYAIAVLFSVEGAPTAVLRFHDRFNLVAWHQLAAATVKLTIAITVWALAPTLTGFLYGWILASVLSHLILNGFAARVFIQRGQSASRSEMMEICSWPLLRYLASSNLDASLRVVRELDVQVVAMFVDEAAAGLLRVARQLANFGGRLVDAFYEAIYPDLARLGARGEWVAFRDFARRSSARVGLVALAGSSVFVVFGKPLLMLCFGEEYAAAYLPTCILLLATVVWGFAQPLAPALMSMGAAGRILVNHAVGVVCYVLLIFWLVPSLSYVGAALAFVGLYAAWALATWVTYHFTVPHGIRSVAKADV